MTPITEVLPAPTNEANRRPSPASQPQVPSVRDRRRESFHFPRASLQEQSFPASRASTASPQQQHRTSTTEKTLRDISTGDSMRDGEEEEAVSTAATTTVGRADSFDDTDSLDDGTITIDISGVPEHIRESKLFGEMLYDYFDQDRVDPANGEAVKDWAIRRCAPWLEYDYKYDLVEYLGGEEAARAYIEGSLSIVTLPAAQTRMIALMEEVGYRKSCADVVAGDNVGDNDTGRTNAYNVGGIGGGNSNASRPSQSRNIQENLQNPGRGFFQTMIEKGKEMKGKRKDTNERTIKIENQRADVDKGIVRGGKVTYFIEMEIDDRTTLRDVMEKVNDTWKIPLDDLSLWWHDNTIKPLTSADDGTLLVQDLGSKMPTTLYLRQHTTRGKLIAAEEQELQLGRDWPIQMVVACYSSREGVFEDFPAPTMNCHDLYDEQDKLDDAFSPYFSMTMEPVYHSTQGPFLKGKTHRLSLQFFFTFGVQKRFSNSDRDRGYFVESVEMELSPSFSGVTMDLSGDTAMAVQSRKGKTISVVKSLKGGVVVGGENIVAANVSAERTNGFVKSEGMSSSISPEWETRLKDGDNGPTTLFFERKYWDRPGAHGVELYPNIDSESGAIPRVSWWSRNRLSGSWKLTKPNEFLTVPSLRAAWNGNANIQDRNEAAKMSVKVTMMLRKIEYRHPRGPGGRRGQRAPKYHEYQQSYRQVVMEGETPLAVFPKSMGCRRFFLWVIYLVVIPAIFISCSLCFVISFFVDNEAVPPFTIFSLAVCAILGFVEFTIESES